MQLSYLVTLKGQSLDKGDAGVTVDKPGKDPLKQRSRQASPGRPHGSHVSLKRCHEPGTPLLRRSGTQDGNVGGTEAAEGFGGFPTRSANRSVLPRPGPSEGFSERRRRGQRGPGLGGPHQEAGACSLPGGPAWTQLETRSSPGRSQAGLGPGGRTRPRPGCPSAAEERGPGRGKQSFPRSAERPPRRRRDASSRRQVRSSAPGRLLLLRPGTVCSRTRRSLPTSKWRRAPSAVPASPRLPLQGHVMVPGQGGWRGPSTAPLSDAGTRPCGERRPGSAWTRAICKDARIPETFTLKPVFPIG